MMTSDGPPSGGVGSYKTKGGVVPGLGQAGEGDAEVHEKGPEGKRVGQSHGAR